MDDVDVPRYFLCPISLQIMKDPVTTVSGITYDRESIERWLATATAPDATVSCPVSKQQLSRYSDLTPNHMLRRLIHAWCVANAHCGIDRIPTPKSPLHRSLVLKLIREVGNRKNCLRNLDALKKMEELANESEWNRKCMAENGAAKAMIFFVLRCAEHVELLGVDRALMVLKLTWYPTAENKQIVEENTGFFDSILWIANSDYENTVKTQALIILKKVSEVLNSAFMKRLNLSFFKEMMNFLKSSISPQATRAVLKVLTATSASLRNKLKIIEAGAVFELIEMELRGQEKKTTELIICLLAHLCSFADGRQQFLRHAGGVAMVAKRLLRVSSATDDRALCLLEAIARYAATRGVVLELLAVGAVTKLCMVIQADCEEHLKKKAREILRLHSVAWNNSPCIQVYLLTRYPR